MTGWNEYDEFEVTQKYKGIPNKQSEEEKSRWQRFWEAALPWLKKKRELGDQFLEAKVRKEQAIAMEHAAGAELKRAQAKKVEEEARLIATQAAKFEQEKLKEESVKELSKEELKEDAMRLAELLKVLKLKYGLEVNISITEINELSLKEKFDQFKEDNVEPFPVSKETDDFDPDIVENYSARDHDA